MTIGDTMFDYRLKFIRERNGISQKQLATQLQINKSTYSNYENEHFVIPLKYLINFCDYFNVSIDYVFGFQKDIYTHSKKGIDFNKSGERIKNFREELKLSQEVFARRIISKRSNISGYEIGKHLISTKNLYQICKKYNISADYLLGKIDSPKYLNK